MTMTSMKPEKLIKGEFMNKSGETILRLRAENAALIKSLAALLEHVKGNRGRKDINPYCVPEVMQALQVLTTIIGNAEFNTRKLAGKV